MSTVQHRRPRLTRINNPSLFTIPAWVVDLESFRRWTEDEDFPDEGRISYLRGELWMDMTKEQIFTHVAVKTEFTRVLSGLAREASHGLFFTDGAYLSHVGADIGVRPDAVFVASSTLESGRVRLIEGKQGGFVELQGSPDMVLEIVSQGSLRKDKVTLRKAYWEAGVGEYWVVDARASPICFEILRSFKTGFRAVGATDGWLKSRVFARSFEFTCIRGRLGHPEYTLSVR